MNKRRIFTFGTTLLPCLLVLTGCGSSEPKADIVETVAAAGVLTYQGKPLEYYVVTFFPNDGKRPGSATTDADGKFILGTNAAGDGAVAGTHKVTVTYQGPPTNEEPGKEEFKPVAPPKVKIPEKYHDIATTDLTIELPKSGSSDLKLELK